MQNIKDRTTIINTKNNPIKRLQCFIPRKQQMSTINYHKLPQGIT